LTDPSTTPFDGVALTVSVARRKYRCECLADIPIVEVTVDRFAEVMNMNFDGEELDELVTDMQDDEFEQLAHDSSSLMSAVRPGKRRKVNANGWPCVPSVHASTAAALV